MIKLIGVEKKLGGQPVLQGVDLSGVDLSTTLLPKGFVPPQGSQAKQKTA